MKYGIVKGIIRPLGKPERHVKPVVTKREKNPEVQRAFDKRVAKRRAKKRYA